jgi:hypothetical protein
MGWNLHATYHFRWAIKFTPNAWKLLSKLGGEISAELSLQHRHKLKRALHSRMRQGNATTIGRQGDRPSNNCFW